MAKRVSIPAGLSGDSVKIWRKINKNYVVSPADTVLLERALNAAQDIATIEASINRSGGLVVDGEVNQLVDALNKTRGIFLSYWRLLNFEKTGVGSES